MYVLCRTPGYSWADFPAVATQDKRAINPGLADDGGGDWQRGDDPDATLATVEEGRVRNKH